MKTMMEPGGATRSSLSEQVRVNLVEKINNGRLLPGDRIVEARVAEELHVSSIPVREAIRGLVAERILEYNVHKGVRVRQVSMAETVDALRVKAVLEGLAARLAGPRLKGEVERLRGTVAPIVESVHRRDFVEFQEQNQLFHRAIVAASGNQILINIWDTLAFEVRTRYIMDYLRVVDPDVLAHEHADILRAIESDDFEEVAALLTSHATHLVGYLEQQMRTDGTAAAAPGAGGEA